ncbi:MAG TPA: response regulator [Blastocatellia bacterium]|nr:response regulator [Blastocatellia bacterium]
MMRAPQLDSLILEQEPRNPAGGQQVSILMVDDHPENLLALEATLSYLDQKIVKANSGREALKLLLGHEFAVILLDVHMPDMDGFETAELIRNREKSQNTPIIFLTAMHKGEGQVFKGYSLGAVDYIFKPFEPEILKAKVSVFIELYKKTEEIKRQAELLRIKNAELDSINKAIMDLYSEIERKNAELETRVQNRTFELARTNEALHAEITERKRVQEQREQLLISEQKARERAEAANRAKDEFLATVSHELRTPLTSILGWARLLRSNEIDASSFVRGLDTIERNAKSQAKIIEDILDVSRIISGKLRIEAHSLDLVPIIEMAVDAVRPAAEAKAIQIQVSLEPEVGPLRGDPNRLQQVAWNLLSNAVKFTPNGGEIHVTLEQGEAGARIIVRDNGSGISPDFMPFVFDRFSQEEGHITRRHGGLGLGLAIVRHLVEMHGGTINVESPGEGRGATFTVELPFTTADSIDADAEPQQAADAEVERSERQADDSPENLPKLDNLRIIVVDDDPDTLHVLTMALGQAGASVKACSSAAEACATLGTWDADLLVSDLGMPEEDGYSLIRRVRALEPELGRTVPAIALTAFASIADRTRALSEGFHMHVSKPVEPAVLLSAIAQLCRDFDFLPPQEL